MVTKEQLFEYIQQLEDSQTSKSNYYEYKRSKVTKLRQMNPA